MESKFGQREVLNWGCMNLEIIFWILRHCHSEVIIQTNLGTYLSHWNLTVTTCAHLGESKSQI